MNDANNPRHFPAELFQKTLDSLRSHIAVLNEDGTIIAVNAPWKKFASGNGLAERFCGERSNYLHSCDGATGECSEEAPVVASGIRDVIAKKQAYFYLEYPCHSPSEQRWFSVRVTRFEVDSSLCVVVTHDDITQRTLAEFQLQAANRLLEFQAATDGLTGVAIRSQKPLWSLTNVATGRRLFHGRPGGLHSPSPPLRLHSRTDRCTPTRSGLQRSCHR